MAEHAPLLLDLFCGRGGWSIAALAAGWRVHGIDIADHGYPGPLTLTRLPCSIEQLVQLQPSLIVASPPCDEFARHHLPWLNGPPPDTSLLRWSIALVSQVKCPVIVECSWFAARHVPGARLCGSYALWGDVPALLPHTPRRKMQSSGMDPARRAMIEPALAGWIMEVMR